MSKKHTPAQVIRKLREVEADLADGATVAHVCQTRGVRAPTFHRWRTRYGGMKADDTTRLKDREVENARPKKLVADRALDGPMLQEVVQKSS